MRIAVNAIFLQKDQLEGYGWLVSELFSRLAKRYPEHEFYLIFDRPYDDSFLFSSNVKALVVGPAARHVPAFKFWYDVSAARAVKKSKQMSGFSLMVFAV